MSSNQTRVFQAACCGAMLAFASAVIIACGHSPAAPTGSDNAGAGPTTFKVLTWNVHQGYSAAKKHVNKEQLDFIASLQPDVVTFQELAEWDNDMPALYRDGLTSRTHRTWTMTYVADVPDDPQRLRQGSGIATSLPIENEQTWHVGDDSQPRNQIRHRGAIGLTLAVAGQRIGVGTTHLDHLDPVNRRNQLDQLQSLVRGLAPMRIVTGDLNAAPDEQQTFGAWAQEYSDAWLSLANPLRGSPGYTVPMHLKAGPARIDYQWFVGIQPTSVRLIDTPLSDHAALLVEWTAR